MHRFAHMERSFELGPVFIPDRRVSALAVTRALRCAVEGLQDAWRTQPNLRLHVYVGAGLIALGAYCRLSLAEWLCVSVAIGLVIFVELLNTAIEQTVDLIVGLRPDPLARRVKDISAGCVLVAAVIALVVECVAFLPHLVRACSHI